MNMADRLKQLETASDAQPRYRLTLADGTSIIMRDLGAVIGRAFQSPGEPRVTDFVCLHAGPYNIIETLMPDLLIDLLQPTTPQG